MLALWNQFDDLIRDDVFARRRVANHAVPAFTPAVDIVETENGYEFAADLPGLKAEDVDVTIEDGVLSISGERKEVNVNGKSGYRRIERTFGRFRRVFALPKGVAADQVTAKVEHGQLKVVVPKPVSKIPSKVKVTTTA